MNNLNIYGKWYTLWHAMPHATLKRNVVCSILLATTLVHVPLDPQCLDFLCTSCSSRFQPSTPRHLDNASSASNKLSPWGAWEVRKIKTCLAHKAMGRHAAPLHSLTSWLHDVWLDAAARAKLWWLHLSTPWCCCGLFVCWCLWAFNTNMRILPYQSQSCVAPRDADGNTALHPWSKQCFAQSLWVCSWLCQELQVVGPCAIRGRLPQFVMELRALASCIQGVDSWPSVSATLALGCCCKGKPPVKDSSAMGNWTGPHGPLALWLVPQWPWGPALSQSCCLPLPWP